VRTKPAAQAATDDTKSNLGEPAVVSSRPLRARRDRRSDPHAGASIHLPGSRCDRRGKPADATGVGLPLSGNNPSKITKLAAPIAASVFVRKPAIRWRDWRSNPMHAPCSVAVPR